MYLYIHPTLTLFFPFLLIFRRPTLTAKDIDDIQNLEGVQNYMDILKSTDGIMVVRTLVATRFTLYPNINALSSKVQPIHSHALFLIYYNLLLPF